MAPIYVKGGLWSNVEDEIVKAAVMKYGLNQWSRVASLLTHKSAKQAKARWFEWLNPVINKQEWTRAEDEKLLSLVKLLPNQWRTISQIIGRTATNAAERYQKLLDDVMGDESGDLGLAGPGIESQVPTGMNLNLEGLPAIPDDLNDDQSEMLVEAKARLANTQGKKAKRKARERMLQESRSLALLQKRRELKAAGINVSLALKNKKLKNEFDYNADIPHERTPQQGLYDTEMELESAEKEKIQFSKQIQASGKTINDKNDKKRKSDDKSKQVDAKKNQVALEAAAELFNQHENDIILKKRKLDLPEVSQDQHVVDIDQNIIDTTKEIIAKQKTKSSLIISDTPESKGFEVPEPQPQAKASLSKKSILKLLKSKFEHLAKPRQESGITLPVYDANEESINLSIETFDQGERLRSLEILQQIEQEQAKLRRSQVVQRGLTIPNPEKLLKHDKLTGVDSLVAQEFEKLIKSDYRKFVDSSYKAPLVEDLDEATFETVNSEIAKELAAVKDRQGKGNDKLGDGEEQYTLPQSFSIAETMINRLHENYATSNEIHEKINADLQACYDEEKQLIDRITDNYNELYEQEHELLDSRALLQEEQAAIERRSKRLHQQVDQIVLAEHAMQDKLRSMRMKAQT